MENKLYRPSNGTEGECFMSEHCFQCIHEKFTHTQNHKDKKCDIMSASLIFDTHEKGYSKEWIYDDNGKPTCTAYKKWDWGNDGDPDDPQNPNTPIPVSPNQLTMPFMVEEIERNTIKQKELV